MNLQIAFFGTSRLAQIVLEGLIKSNYKPQLVITAPDTKAGRGQILQMSPVKQTALKKNIKVLQPKSLSSKSFQFELAILVAYGKIIPKEILDIPKYGFVNIHPSLLPKYRGPSPIQSAILAGEEKTGVSIIILDKEIDHGPILAQKEIPIEEDDTHASLIEKSGKIGVRLLIEILPNYLDGSLKPKPQNHSQATFTKKVTKADGKLDPDSPPRPQKLDRMIRAYYPWPGVWTELKWKVESGKWKVLKVKFLPNLNYQTTQPPNYPTNFLIQPEGKRPMTIKEFLNGYPQVKQSIEKLYPIPTTL